MRSSSYDGLAVWFGTALWEQQIAGFHSPYNKAMIMRTGVGADDILKNKWTVVVCPAKRMPTDLSALRRDIERSGLLVKEYMSAPLAAVKYYLGQQEIAKSTKKIYVADVQSHYSEISLVENNNGKIRLSKVQRVPVGKEQLVELAMEHYRKQIRSDLSAWSQIIVGELVLKSEVSKVLEYMLACRRPVKSFSVTIPEWEKTCELKMYREDLDCFCKKLLTEVLDEQFFEKTSVGAKGFFEKAKVCCGIKDAVPMILLGEFFHYDDGVNLVREKFPHYQILSYKPAQAAVLGAAEYAHERTGTQSVIFQKGMPDSELQESKPMGNVKHLNSDQQEVYRQLIDALEAKKSKVRIWVEDPEQLSSIVEALVYDRPDLEVVWDCDESRLYHVGCMGEMDWHLVYKPDWKETLEEIDWKVEDILRRCIGHQKLSDAELVSRLYAYIAKHYIYAPKNEDGEWPLSASSLEAVLDCGICAGYAKAIYYCLKKLQIPVTCVLGDAGGSSFGGHAWNIFQMSDGTYTHLDVTWDLGRREARTKYFAIDDTAMRARRHFWKPLDYPVCAC